MSWIELELSSCTLCLSRIALDPCRGHSLPISRTEPELRSCRSLPESRIEPGLRRGGTLGRPRGDTERHRARMAAPSAGTSPPSLPSSLPVRTGGSRSSEREALKLPAQSFQPWRG